MASIKTTLVRRKPALRYAQYLYHLTIAFGFDPRTLFGGARGIPAVLRDYVALRKQNKATGKPWDLRLTMPCPHDRYASSGTASGHYFHQDLLVAGRIWTRRPQKHVDVGSRVDGFVAHVAAFRPIEVLDIRPLAVTIRNITFRECDLMNLPGDLVDYCDSLSCLHALEHFGLGRYGDPLDLNGHLRGFESLYRMLKRDGTLYLSFPVGPERIDFNAHRVFAIQSVLNWVKDRYELIAFSFVDDMGNLHENAVLDDRAIADNCGVYYGCGIFELRKL